MSEQQVQSFKVYSAIASVAADLAQDGITKNRKNVQQGFQFRGIDDVYNALSPLLAKHKLVILPRMLTREVSERETQKGGTLFSVVVKGEFTFVSAEDGSRHTVEMFGEAMDSGDKATNKAMSAAYKYAAFQAFCIPTQAMDDADEHTPDPVKPKMQNAATSKPSGQDAGAFKRAVAAAIVKQGFTKEQLKDAAILIADAMNVKDLADLSEHDRRGLLTTISTGTYDNIIRKYLNDKATEANLPPNPQDFASEVYDAFEARGAASLSGRREAAKAAAKSLKFNDIREIAPDGRRTQFLADIAAGKFDQFIKKGA